MKLIMNLVAKSLLLMMCFNSISISAKELTINELLDKVDLLYRSDTSYSIVEMEVITPHWQRVLKLEMWTKGLNKTFVRLLSPRKDKGVATLRIDNDMWNFFPKIDRTIKVPSSMRMGSWMGSDFTNDDIVKETTLRDDYISNFIATDELENYVIELRPKKGTVSVWDRIVIYIERKGILPVKQLFYNERNELVRTMFFKDVKNIGGRTMPATMELIPNKKKGQKTIVRYLNVEFDKKFGPNIFTRQHLQMRR